MYEQARTEDLFLTRPDVVGYVDLTYPTTVRRSFFDFAFPSTPQRGFAWVVSSH